MSYWYEPKKKDLDITEDGEELHVYLGSDESGNIYASLKIKDINDLLGPLKRKKGQAWHHPNHKVK